MSPVSLWKTATPEKLTRRSKLKPKIEVKCYKYSMIIPEAGQRKRTIKRATRSRSRSQARDETEEPESNQRSHTPVTWVSWVNTENEPIFSSGASVETESDEDKKKKEKRKRTVRDSNSRSRSRSRSKSKTPVKVTFAWLEKMTGLSGNITGTPSTTDQPSELTGSNIHFGEDEGEGETLEMTPQLQPRTRSQTPAYSSKDVKKKLSFDPSQNENAIQEPEDCKAFRSPKAKPSVASKRVIELQNSSICPSPTSSATSSADEDESYTTGKTKSKLRTKSRIPVKLQNHGINDENAATSSTVLKSLKGIRKEVKSDALAPLNIGAREKRVRFEDQEQVTTEEVTTTEPRRGKRKRAEGVSEMSAENIPLYLALPNLNFRINWDLCPHERKRLRNLIQEQPQIRDEFSPNY